MNQTDIEISIAANLEATRKFTLASCSFKELGHFIDFLMDIPTTDLDAANFLHEVYRSKFTYIPTTANKGEWYFWNDAVHEKHELNQIDDYLATGLADYLLDIAKHLLKQARLNLSDGDRDKANDLIKGLYSYAKQIRSTGGIQALKVRIKFKFTKPAEYFDNDSQWAVLADGMVLDLHDLDGDLLKPDSKRPVSRSLGVIYDEAMGFPVDWVESLDKWVPDKEVQLYLQVAAGAALLGKGDAKNIVALVGVSNTGKSTYINILKKVFGGYAGSLPATAIVQKYGGNTNFEQSKARGKRFLYLSEPQKQRTDDAFLKNLSGGGETISTANKGQDTVEWYAQCVLHIASNHIPDFDTQDNAIVDRMNLVGFDHVFVTRGQGSADKFAEDMVEKEGSAILAWIIEGAAIYREEGFIPVPDAIKNKSKDNIVEASAPLRWLHEVIEEGYYYLVPGAPGTSFAKPVELYEQFSKWCFTTGEKTVKQKTWLAEIERFNAMPASKKGTRPGGFARVYGVVPASAYGALSEGQNMHNVAGRTSVSWVEMYKRADSAPEVQ